MKVTPFLSVTTGAKRPFFPNLIVIHLVVNIFRIIIQGFFQTLTYVYKKNITELSVSNFEPTLNCRLLTTLHL